MITIAPLSEDLAPKLAVELGLKLDEYDKIVEILGRHADRDRALHVLAHVERALQLQALAQGAAHVPDRRARTCCRARARTPASSAWATAGRSPSRWSRTTTRAPSSPTRARRPASAASSATSSRWARGPSPRSNSLRFGTLDKPRQRYLFEGSVAGIGGYGNCLGVPDRGRRGLLRGSLRGQLPHQRDVDRPHARGEILTRATATGPGNLVLLIGSTTGRDGIGGASRAREPGVRRARRGQAPGRPGGRPVRGEAAHRGVPRAARGRAARGPRRLRRGRADVSSHQRDGDPRRRRASTSTSTKIPAREDEMKPFEFMVSESQERMLAVVEPEKLEAAQAVCTKWGLRSTVIGTVTDTGRFVVRAGRRDRRRHARRHARARRAHLRPRDGRARPTSTRCRRSTRSRSSMPDRARPTSARRCCACSRAPTSARATGSGSSTTTRSCSTPSCCPAATPPCCASATRPGERGIAVSQRLQRPLLLPRPVRGRADRVRRGRAQRRVRRRRPRGDHRLPQLRQSREARGLLDLLRGRSAACPTPARRSACRSSRGNVSFYNESFGQPIYPTPTVGLVGVLDDVDQALHRWRSRTRAT